MALASTLLAGALALSCSSSSSSPSGAASCGTDTTVCKAGTTCWPADSVPNLSCLPSDQASGFGAACQQTPGKATCADGMACDQESAAGGTCTYYCGNRVCPTNYSCFTTNIGGPNGPAIDICRAGGLPGQEGGVPMSGDGGGFTDAAFIPDGPAGDGGPAHQ